MDEPTGISQQGSWQYVAPNGEVTIFFFIFISIMTRDRNGISMIFGKGNKTKMNVMLYKRIRDFLSYN